ncbi:hypothetical protein CEXT_87281 [Caerostris extrusa]|uniref:Uncharacterized protein n=1 Tax=Caerostris extrusa TaxID=172846 RepID=A0AAV4PU08_CAEEX|nr:hypothetical protein CEXT_87281 [Caerostris extrusa]
MPICRSNLLSKNQRTILMIDVYPEGTCKDRGLKSNLSGTNAIEPKVLHAKSPAESQPLPPLRLGNLVSESTDCNQRIQICTCYPGP